MTKTMDRNTGKYRNLRQNNAFWLNFHTKRPNLAQIQRIWTLWPSSFETLGHFLLYSISLSTKMTKTINTNAGKYRNLRQNNVFGSISIQNVQICPNSTNLDPLTEFFWNPCSFFVVIYQPEHKNDKDNQHKRWQVPKFATKQRFWLNFHTKRPNLSKMSPNSTVSASFLWTFGHFLVYPIRLSKKMPKDFKIFTDKYRNLRQNNGIA